MQNGNDYNSAQPIVEVVRVLDGLLEFRTKATDELIFDVQRGRLRFYDTAGIVTFQADESGISYKGAPVGYVKTAATITLDDFTVANVPCVAGSVMDLVVHANRGTEAEAVIHVEITKWKTLTPLKINVISMNAVKTTGLDVLFSINAGSSGIDINVKNALGGTITYSYTTRMSV